MNGISVEGFQEKPVGDGAWINGGFFVLSPDVLDLIEGDATVWEREPMERLAASGQLRRTSIRGSGSLWTRCAKRIIWKTFGKAAKRPGNSGAKANRNEESTDHRYYGAGRILSRGVSPRKRV